MLHACNSWSGPQLPSGHGYNRICVPKSQNVLTLLSKKSRGFIPGIIFSLLCSVVDGSILPEGDVEDHVPG